MDWWRSVWNEAAVLEAGALIPLLNLGQEQREADETVAVVTSQLSRGLAEVKGAELSNLVVAYEPVWAIGENGIPATSDYADDRQGEIVAVAEEVLGRRVPCLYGGSVNPGNCQELIQCPHIDGLFIGRSAWNVAGYLDILARCATVI